MFLNIVTYTHHNCKDVWDMYFSLLDRYLPEFKSYVISDEFKYYDNHHFNIYNDNDDHWNHWINFLENQNFDYFLYMLEDFFLYKKPDTNKLEYYTNYLKKSNDSFVRLLANDFSPRKHIENDIFRIPTNDPFFFCMQPTIWKRLDFIKMYKLAKMDNWMENIKYTNAAIKCNLVGNVVYNNENYRGEHHYDCKVFPYIATGLIKGKWNIKEYKKELIPLVEEFKIDMNIRGLYLK